MSRRGENIYKRKDGRWEGRYISDYDTAGKAKYKFVYAKTYGEIRIKMQNRPESERLKSTNTIVSDWILWYLESKKAKLKLSTIKLYERHINNYIKPFFENISLKKLNKEILQAFVNSISDMSPATVTEINTVKQNAYGAALVFRLSAEIRCKSVRCCVRCKSVIYI
ncbi:MAG: hypothetical protein J1G06_01055 [Oscillospiraceae bacterium]|nr:hypothetical protein [Oscillospiraceae bacterium]